MFFPEQRQTSVLDRSRSLYTEFFVYSQTLDRLLYGAATRSFHSIGPNKEARLV